MAFQEEFCLRSCNAIGVTEGQGLALVPGHGQAGSQSTRNKATKSRRPGQPNLLRDQG